MLYEEKYEGMLDDENLGQVSGGIDQKGKWTVIVTVYDPKSRMYRTTTSIGHDTQADAERKAGEIIEQYKSCGCTMKQTRIYLAK